MLRVLAAALCVRAREDHALLRRPACDPCSARCGQHAWNQLGSSSRLTFLAIPKSSTRHTHGLLRRAAGPALAYVHVRPRARVDGGPGDDRPCAAARRLRALHPLDGELLALAHATLDAAEVTRTG